MVMDGYVECVLDSNGWNGPGLICRRLNNTNALIAPNSDEICDGLDNDGDGAYQRKSKMVMEMDT